MIKVIGIAIIVASFVYVMKNHDKSMMQNLMEKKSAKAKACMEAAKEEAEQKTETISE